MFSMLYRTGCYSYFTRINIPYSAGMIATFTDNREVGICNDLTMPCGFFTTEVSPFGQSDRTFVAIGQGEYQTDVYEKPLKNYKLNDFLYCSKNGKITNESKYRGNIIIGIVNDVSEDYIGFITCFARGLEVATVIGRE